MWFCTVPDDLPQMLLDDDEAEVRRLDKRSRCGIATGFLLATQVCRGYLGALPPQDLLCIPDVAGYQRPKTP